MKSQGASQKKLFEMFVIIQNNCDKIPFTQGFYYRKPKCWSGRDGNGGDANFKAFLFFCTNRNIVFRSFFLHSSIKSIQKQKLRLFFTTFYFCTGHGTECLSCTGEELYHGTTSLAPEAEERGTELFYCILQCLLKSTF